jgi:Rha family phage regulatory protein
MLQINQNELRSRIRVVDGKPIVTSLVVAEHFEKDHKNVMRDIRDLVAAHSEDQDFANKHFIPSVQVDIGGRKQPIFKLTATGFSALALGFSGSKAKKWQRLYLNTFEAMSAELAELAKEGHSKALKERDASIALLKEEVAENKVEIEQLKTALDCAPPGNHEQRIKVFKRLFKARKDLLEEQRLKTRYVIDADRMSSAETALILSYALTTPEAAILWLLMQAGGMKDPLEVSVATFLFHLKPHIKSISTISSARTRLVERGLISLYHNRVRNKAHIYVVSHAKVYELLVEFLAKQSKSVFWTQEGKKVLPGVTDINGRSDNSKKNFDLLMPKTPLEVVDNLKLQMSPQEKWEQYHAMSVASQLRHDKLMIEVKSRPPRVQPTRRGLMEAKEAKKAEKDAPGWDGKGFLQ